MAEINNTVIEQAVIGSLFQWYDELSEYINSLNESDFTECRELFKVLKSAYTSGKHYDSVLLLGDAKEAGIMDKAAECIQSVYTIISFKDYYIKLIEISRRRRIHDEIFNLYQAGSFDIESLKDIINREEETAPLTSVKEKAIDNIHMYLENLGKREERIYTGFSTMDRVIGGFRYGSVCYIGARPSVGKTTFAVNIANKQKNKNVLFFSLEMNAGMIFDKCAASDGGTLYSDFTKQSLSERSIARTKEVIGRLAKEKRFFVVDDIYNIEAMGSAIMNIKPDLVIIDYIQKVNSLRNFINIRDKIEYISGELKRIAKTFSCVIICLSQLSRDGQSAPTMSNLKESGALEADGDYIILLHRPFVVEKKEYQNPETTEVLIDKNKFGETGIINMRFIGEYQRFVEIDERYDEKL